jgi:hypothetical protein
MAYYEDEDKEQNNPNTPNVGETQDTSSQTVTGQDSAGPGGQASSAPKTASPAKAAAAPPFTGIQQYIDANKSQTQKLANSLSNYVNNLGNTARGAIADQQKKFNTVVDQSTVNYNADLANRAASNPTSVAGNQADLSNFYKMRDAQYGGPNSFANSDYYDSAHNAVSAANEAANALGSQAGQQTILTKFENQNGRPNPGAAAFDSVLLQADPNAVQTLRNTKAAQADLDELLNKVSTAGNTYAKNAANTTAATRNTIQNQFYGDNSPLATLEKRVTDSANTQREVANQNAAGVLDALKRRTLLNPGSMQQLGITSDDLQHYKDLESQLEAQGIRDFYDLSKYATLTPNNVSITPQNAASPEDYARAAALYQLMGLNDSFLGDPSQSGKSSGSGINFDYDKLIQDMQQAIKVNENKKPAPMPIQQIALPNAHFGGSGGFSISDKNKKKDIKHFDAKSFLEKLSACK